MTHEARPRIGLVIGQLTEGGAERQLYELAIRLPSRGFHPTVFCLSQADQPYGEMLREAGVEVHCLERRRRLEPRRIRLLGAALKETRVELLHAFLFVGNLYGYLAARRAGIESFLPSVRSLEFTRPWPIRLLDQRMFTAAPLILVNSNSLAERLAAQYRIRPGQLRVVSNGLDLSRFPMDPGEKASNSGSLVIGSVSLFKKEKRIPMILEIALRLSRARGDVVFRVVGDGPEYPAMLSLREELGLREIVEMPGGSDRIPEELAAFDIFLLASEREGMPNAVLEAMAAGIPVVASNVTGTKDVVRDGESGILFAHDSVEEAVEALSRLLDDPAHRRSLGAAGRRLAHARYGVDAMVDATVKVYRELQEASG